MSTRIQVRRDTTANWTSADPVLAAGEFGMDTTTGDVKVGDGTTAWSSLTAFGGSGATTLDGLTDVATAGAATGEALVYDGAAWGPSAAAAVLTNDSRLSAASETASGIVELATTAEALTGTDAARAVTAAGVKAVADTKLPLTQTINAQTGTTYTLVAGDAGKLVTCTNAAAITVTLPQDSDATFAVGTRVDFAVLGAGMVTFAAGTGATANGTPSLVTRAQYSAATCIKRAANTWLVVGDLA